MARIVAEQAVKLRIMEIALQKNAKPRGGQAGRLGVGHQHDPSLTSLNVYAAWPAKPWALAGSRWAQFR